MHRVALGKRTCADTAARGEAPCGAGAEARPQVRVGERGRGGGGGGRSARGATRLRRTAEEATQESRSFQKDVAVREDVAVGPRATTTSAMLKKLSSCGIQA